MNRHKNSSILAVMSKYSSLPGYDTTSPTCYGDNEDTTASLPESDQQWKGQNTQPINI